MMFRRLSVPRGIEALLHRAAVDTRFRGLLLDDPLAAAAAAGLELSTSERAVLGALPGDQLARLVDRIAG
ncbi:MAG: Os1348 family NHLP clan protein [Planctomycetes bacterium]|jgi:hypothetical protein|nr:Os1348 family NHLP clan protein [Planctomycetota bacterium]